MAKHEGPTPVALRQVLTGGSGPRPLCIVSPPYRLGSEAHDCEHYAMKQDSTPVHDDQWRLTLGRWAHGDEGIYFEGLRSLTREEYDDLRVDFGMIGECETSVFFAALQDNITKWSGLDRAFRHGKPSPGGREFAPDSRILVRRHLTYMANVLSAARMYLDATSDALSKTHGKTSYLRSAFLQSTNTEYDALPGYRLCGRLRNVIQHASSLPLRVVATREEGQVRHRLLADRDSLLAADDWNAAIRADLAAGDAEVDIGEALRTYWQALVRIEHARVLRQLQHRLPSLRRLLEELRSCGLRGDEPSLLLRSLSPTAKEGGRLQPLFGPSVATLERFITVGAEGHLGAIFASSSQSTEEDGDEVRAFAPSAVGLMQSWLIGDADEVASLLRALSADPGTSMAVMSG